VSRPAPSPGRQPGRPPHAQPGVGQPALDGMADPEPFKGHDGSTRRAVRDAVEVAKAAGLLEPIHYALAALAVEVGAAVDLAHRRGDPYGIATASRELGKLLSQLGMVPTPAPAGDSKNGVADDVAAFLRGLGEPTVGDTAQS